MTPSYQNPIKKWHLLYKEDTIIPQEYSYDRRADRIKNYNH